MELVRHFVVKAGAKGPRHYWQPSKHLRGLGWMARRLADDRAAALAEAERLNVEVDAGRANPPRPDRGPAMRGCRLYVLGVAGERDGPVKIGAGVNVERRRRQLQGAAGRQLETLFEIGGALVRAATVERKAHALLAAHRLEGEWFAVSPRAAVAAIMQALDGA